MGRKHHVLHGRSRSSMGRGNSGGCVCLFFSFFFSFLVKSFSVVYLVVFTVTTICGD